MAMFETCGAKCEYCEYGERADIPILFLHGWGGDISSFAGVCKNLSGYGRYCVNYAFPKSPPDSWGIYDYAAQTGEFIQKKLNGPPIVVGHSFGGRVGIILAAQGRCKKLVLVDSAGIKPRPSLKKRLKVAAYHRAVKCGKPLDGFGSVDYNNLTPQMRRVFVRVVNAHLDELLPYIACPTLIFWGRQDRETPPYMARRLHRGIKNSTLVFAEGGHYSYLDSPYAFLRELNNFF